MCGLLMKRPAPALTPWARHVILLSKAKDFAQKGGAAFRRPSGLRRRGGAEREQEGKRTFHLPNPGLWQSRTYPLYHLLSPQPALGGGFCAWGACLVLWGGV